ncbi:HAD-IIIA family hydrolase [Candidatus Enterococcus willemsii]|uniref:D,D-heptose 1,7-bisphosphate phosphatase n=1 Tax=Candidatus Enterococcus willemsii TaxID=1857215 RepID=A0ABQ6Z334_9ENTE|nr:HAD-IIIA family hydrolase [Enterococcus sp. CU12B]KAF1305606.1 hypothetical protein BAU17_13365 [Enterococcus sp. CU12B]
MKFDTVFIDRDGTIGGNGHYCSVEDFVLFEHSLASIQLLKEKGCRVFALTNQTKISDGTMNEEELRCSLLAMGFTDVFICPHHETEGCHCRKPKIGLIEEAENKYLFERKNAVIIGDSYKADMGCAKNSQIVGIHVATGRDAEDKSLCHAHECLEVADIYEAAQWIVAQNSKTN